MGLGSRGSGGRSGPSGVSLAIQIASTGQGLMIPVEFFAKWNPMYAPFMEGKMSHEQVIQMTTACTSMMRHKTWYTLLVPVLVVVAEIIFAKHFGDNFFSFQFLSVGVLCCVASLLFVPVELPRYFFSYQSML